MVKLELKIKVRLFPSISKIYHEIKQSGEKIVQMFTLECDNAAFNQPHQKVCKCVSSRTTLFWFPLTRATFYYAAAWESTVKYVIPYWQLL